MTIETDSESSKGKLVLEDIAVRVLGNHDYQRILDKVETGKKAVMTRFSVEEREIYERISNSLAASETKTLFDGELSFVEIGAFYMKEARTVAEESLMSNDPFSGSR